MLIKWHILIGAIFSLILYFMFKLTFLNVIIFFSSSFLIDVDHYFFYIIKKKDLSIKKAYKYFVKKRQLWESFSSEEFKKLKIDHLIFHGIEFLFILFILSFFFQVFFYIFLGVLLHLLVDYYEIVNKKFPLYAKFSQIFLLIKNRKI
jgi:hypothetical protein